MSNLSELSACQSVTFHFAPSQTDALKVPKHLFAAKMQQPRERYSDLDIFRQEILQSKAGLHHQPYTQNKKSVLHYKLTFYTLTLLFLILGFFAMSLSTAVGYGLLFNTSSLMKSVLCSLCFTLSGACFVMSLSIRTEREAVMLCIRKARATIATIYARKRMRLGIGRYLGFFGRNRKLALALKHFYDEAMDKINDKKDEAMHLVHRIATAKTLSFEEKETLFNQAIEELSEKLMTHAHTFRQAALPHIKTN